MSTLGSVWEMPVPGGWFVVAVVSMQDDLFCTVLVLMDDEFPKTAGRLVGTDLDHVGRRYTRLG